jgi:hypothetical protein
VSSGVGHGAFFESSREVTAVISMVGLFIERTDMVTYFSPFETPEVPAFSISPLCSSTRTASLLRHTAPGAKRLQ